MWLSLLLYFSPVITLKTLLKRLHLSIHFSTYPLLVLLFDRGSMFSMEYDVPFFSMNIVMKVYVHMLYNKPRTKLNLSRIMFFAHIMNLAR